MMLTADGVNFQELPERISHYPVVLVVFKIPPLTLSIVIDSKISLLLTYGFCGDHIIIQFQIVNESVNVLQRVETVPCH